MNEVLRVVRKRTAGLLISVPVRMQELQRWDCFVLENPDGSTCPLPTQPVSLVATRQPTKNASDQWEIECVPQIVFELEQRHPEMPRVRFIISECVTDTTEKVSWQTC